MKSFKWTSILFLAATILLKLSSMVRDMIIAYYFGDSYITDAYLAAFVIPNMLILFMITGMKNAFVPSYIESLSFKKEKQHLTDILKGTAVFGFFLSVIGVLLTPKIIALLYPNFHIEAREIAVWVSMIYFMALFFVCLNSVLEGLFDAERKFTFSVLSQVIVVLFTIGGAVALSPIIGVYSLPIGFLIGSVVTLVVKLLAIRRRKLILFGAKVNWPDVKKFYLIFLPVGITVAVGQINLLVDTIFANQFGEGVIAYLNYANRLVHFPQAIFGVTIGTIIFPLLSRAVTTNNDNLFRRGIEQGLIAMFFILLPSVIGMMLLMEKLIQIIFERGAFTATATTSTTEVAILYLGSVLFYSLHAVITKGFYSKKKGQIILAIGSGSILLNVLFNYMFTQWLGYKGLALASSIVGAIYVSICFVILIKLSGGLNLKHLFKEFGKTIISTAIMVVALTFTMPYLSVWVTNSIVYVAIVGLLGACIFALFSILFKTSAINIILRKKERVNES